MRAGYVLHSLECLESGVVGKCCSNVLCCLRAYGLPLKAVRTRAREMSDTEQVRSSRMRDTIHTTEIEVIYANIPNTNTHACLGRDNARA
jgi:hypothetical protein